MKSGLDNISMDGKEILNASETRNKHALLHALYDLNINVPKSNTETTPDIFHIM